MNFFLKINEILFFIVFVVFFFLSFGFYSFEFVLLLGFERRRYFGYVDVVFVVVRRVVLY